MTKTKTSPASPSVRTPADGVAGTWTQRDGRLGYTITRFDHMPPFFMNVVSDTDTWMFVSSRGALTAGRMDCDHAIFPYETEDKLHRAAGLSGPVTLLRVTRDGGDGGDGGTGGVHLWEPFTGHAAPDTVTRSLSKSELGNRVCFQETHHGLGLTFSYTWAHADRFGIVRTATLRNDTDEPAQVELLDGVRSVLPAGPPMTATQAMSCLVNAYTRCEYLADAGLGLFTMQSVLTDLAEPAESLTANVCWHVGLEDAEVFLGAEALEAFRLGHGLRPQQEYKGRLGSYLLRASRGLPAGGEVAWKVVLDAALSQAKVAGLRAVLRSERAGLAGVIDADIQAGDARLRGYLASADALQSSADTMACAHHTANVLFNVMRGGVFVDGDRCPGADVAAFIRERNRAVAERHAAWLGGLPEAVGYDALAAEAAATGDTDLVRLVDEYLPLHFGRRHGDPSRPWNRFSIHVRDEHGNRRLSYEGNWRDIFQNWEALLGSFPVFTESVIAKFVNASTADGFNPYRITREGVDWETPDPGNPWANIGYWGDHQIIYLCKLLEQSRRFHPGKLEAMLTQRRFAYADVPYRIKPYTSLVADPRNTVDFDADADRAAKRRSAIEGGDGRLMRDSGGGVLHVTLAEKLLVPILAKLSNLVPGGGIWMNTQRPEWNDANNALVGSGVSVVTLCYLRRHLRVCASLVEGAEAEAFALSPRVAQWMEHVAGVLREHRAMLDGDTVLARDRRAVIDALGGAFGAYREGLYADGLGGQTDVPKRELLGLFETASAYLDHAIRANRRPDGMYHAYNLLRFTDGDPGGGAEVDHLYEMAEGQVAALSSGALGGAEAVAVIDAMYASPLYRADQDSFMLYPARHLPGFLEKNIVPAERVERDALLSAMLDAGDTRIVVRDDVGTVRFHHRFKNAAVLAAALDEVAGDARWSSLVGERRGAVLDLYEAVFNHHAFTGRSGGMYGYEGIGCIYWHMISKLLLAVQENVYLAQQRGEGADIVASLVRRYRRVRDGLGYTKPPAVYGAFPADPYSHTPAHAGAQQPGMTGQVKEEILTRWGEVGVTVAGGCVAFDPALLDPAELHDAPAAWSYLGLDGGEHELTVPAGALAFTLCQTPVLCRGTAPGETPGITVHTPDAASRSLRGLTLDADTSAAIFNRTGEVARLEVAVPVAKVC